MPSPPLRSSETPDAVLLMPIWFWDSRLSSASTATPGPAFPPMTFNDTLVPGASTWTPAPPFASLSVAVTSVPTRLWTTSLLSLPASRTPARSLPDTRL
jgi:hypothetical protein